MEADLTTKSRCKMQSSEEEEEEERESLSPSNSTMRGEEGGGRVLLLRSTTSPSPSSSSSSLDVVVTFLSSPSLSKQLPALPAASAPCSSLLSAYYFLRLLFPFCLHAGVREAERNEGTRSVSAYSTRSFLSASRASRENKKNVASIGIAETSEEESRESHFLSPKSINFPSYDL